MLRVYRVSGGTRTPHELAIHEVADVLLAGGLALVPTETVYGIGVAVAPYAASPEGAAQLQGVPQPGDAALPPAASGYRRIFSLKQRDLAQTVPWLVAGERDLDTYGAEVGDETRALARAFWPGALTLVVKASSVVPAFLRAADGTVALRASASPVVQALIRACGSPLAVTSANTHGAPAPAAFSDVEARVLQGVDVAVDAGSTACQAASTIVSFASGSLEVVREGALTSSQIQHALQLAVGRS